MTSLFQSSLVRLAVLLLGVALWYAAGARVQKAGLHVAEPNVLCLKGSPFGKTIAMAMQGPVDVYWHEGEVHEHDHSSCESCEDCDGHHSGDREPAEGPVAVSATNCDHEGCNHDHQAGHHQHAPGEGCEGCDLEAVEAKMASLGAAPYFRQSLLDQIQDWRAVSFTRHNPHANSEIHREFLRREVEKKLMLTYRMDPINYASYGAYFLFLSETSLSDRPESIQHAVRLAQATVEFCLREQESVTALLTGAAAAHDASQLLMKSEDPGAQRLAAQYGKVAEDLLDGFEQVAMQMAFDGSWDNFSALRRDEMSGRADLLRKLVENNRAIQEKANADRGKEPGADNAG